MASGFYEVDGEQYEYNLDYDPLDEIERTVEFNEDEDEDIGWDDEDHFDDDDYFWDNSGEWNEDDCW